MLANGVLVVALTMLAVNYLLPWLEIRFPSTPYLQAGLGLGVLLAAGPFLWAIFSASGFFLLQKLTWRRENRSLLFIYSFATVVGLGVLLFLLHEFFPLVGSALILGFGAMISFLAAPRYAESFYRKLEGRFLENLGDRGHVSEREHPALAPWDAQLVEATVSADSPSVGKTLQDAGLQERFQVIVTVIERGSQRLVAPGGRDFIYPGDRLFLIGAKEAAAAARQELEEVRPLAETRSAFGLSSVELNKSSPLVGRLIRDPELRGSLGGLIVGLEREGKRFLNPDSGVRLLQRDLLWVVGDLEKIAKVKNL